ncbi:hypothetical protein K469DRAFT_561973 [Zopfia rhizophila CBS 207.26]|uniref:F-box domain-containing protein n=1 Tax=Zopfia rhizophila CBS 207.26 TaxID=1314779 RepID=A0A6A6EGP4_9PEZI|nr:hypothetical protein K469DRAFT_561973 [Zopfia rhizophila CBS 207.26]
MAKLTNLPTELLEQIYHSLGSIDDVLHLGRACKATHNVLDNDKTWLEIMRSVIYRSPAHRFDVQLCKILELHRDLVQHFKSGGAALPVSRLQKCILDQSYLNDNVPIEAAISDEDVYDILARWQGLRVLQDIFLTRELEAEDYLSVVPEGDADDFIQDFTDLLNGDADTPKQPPFRASSATKEYRTLNADQTARFHAAITSLWVLSEIRWVLALFQTPSNFLLPLLILRKCKEHIERQTHIPLLDELDRLSIHKFLYHHLLPLHSRALTDQTSSELPLTFPSDLQESHNHGARLLQTFLLAGQTYLQPPDIIELAVRNKLMLRRPYPMMHPPPSTHQYWHPFNPSHITYPQNHPLVPAAGAPIPFRNALLANINIVMRGLVPLRDLQDEWLRERVLGQFYVRARRDRKDIEGSFKRPWKKEVRWGIWWWANSEEKARAKMERWRRV